ncbi:hypothetical protein [Terrihabitans sp. B22-R8]|uniref:hypothetical protein n=1 Tax=Terrihabitans sp. B22-R8 TaxID=3425128 RepID=UPI00403C2C18
MSDVYMIEIDDRALGLVARDPVCGTYRFHAALPETFELDGKLFDTPDEARRAARKMLGMKPRHTLQELDYAA